MPRDGGEQSAGLRFAETEGCRRCARKATNHGGIEIDVAPGIQIYHPKQVAAKTMPDRLLNKA